MSTPSKLQLLVFSLEIIQRSHITPIISSLHWLPIQLHISILKYWSFTWSITDLLSYMTNQTVKSFEQTVPHKHYKIRGYRVFRALFYGTLFSILFVIFRLLWNVHETAWKAFYSDGLWLASLNCSPTSFYCFVCTHSPTFFIDVKHFLLLSVNMLYK